MRIIIFSLTIIIIVGCKNLFVPNSRLILHEEGYFVFSSKNYLRFFPSKIDTNLSISENLDTHSLKPGYYLYQIPPKQARILRNCSDVYGDIYIVRGKIEYVITKTNKSFRKDKEKFFISSFEFEGKRYLSKLHGRVNVYTINATPLLKLKREIYISWMLNGSFDEFVFRFNVSNLLLTW